MQVPQSVLNFFMAVLQNENLRAQFTKAFDSQDTPTLLNLAKKQGYDFTANELRQGLKQIHNILPNPVEIENLSLREYRCTRNASYSHECIGRDDPSARQGYYFKAHSAEEAWEQMATRFPEETDAGFTVEEWESFNVTVVQVERDEDGNIIE
ncbi:MAG: Nif11 family protein [Hydrococcus sp. RM1_1_31]|nr:Nif11 family protein [Hydrococcus sp. RM1_1_31]